MSFPRTLALILAVVVSIGDSGCSVASSPATFTFTGRDGTTVSISTPGTATTSTSATAATTSTGAVTASGGSLVSSVVPAGGFDFSAQADGR